MCSTSRGSPLRTGRRLSGLRTFARWSTFAPDLARFRGLPDVVRVCRDGLPAPQDAILGTLLVVGKPSCKRRVGRA